MDIRVRHGGGVRCWVCEVDEGGEGEGVGSRSDDGEVAYGRFE